MLLSFPGQNFFLFNKSLILIQPLTWEVGKKLRIKYMWYMPIVHKINQSFTNFPNFSISHHWKGKNNGMCHLDSICWFLVNKCWIFAELFWWSFDRRWRTNYSFRFVANVCMLKNMLLLHIDIVQNIIHHKGMWYLPDTDGGRWPVWGLTWV